MSIDSIAVCWAHSEAPTQAALLVLLGIAEADGEGGAWPGMEKLARRARITRDAARKHVRTLEKLGEIRSYINEGGGRHTPKHMRTNYYEVLLECPWWCDKSREHRDLREERHEQRRPSNWADIVTYFDLTPRIRALTLDELQAGATPQPAGGGPSVRLGAPQPMSGANPPVTTPLGNSPNRSEESRANDRVSESSNEEGKPPRRYGKIAAAQKIANKAKRQQYLAPMRPEPEPEARQAANKLALTLPCPSGVGNGKHLVLIGTGTECAHCGTDTFTILDQHNQTRESA